MRATPICLAAMCALVLALPAAPASQPNVRGILVRPAFTGCYPDEPCDPPAVGALLVFTRAGHPATTIRVGASGRFALHLAPGRYGVRAAPALLSGDLTPSSFRVPRSGTVYLRLQIRRGVIPAPAGSFVHVVIGQPSRRS